MNARLTELASPVSRSGYGFSRTVDVCKPRAHYCAARQYKTMPCGAVE